MLRCFLIFDMQDARPDSSVQGDALLVTAVKADEDDIPLPAAQQSSSKSLVPHQNANGEPVRVGFGQHFAGRFGHSPCFHLFFLRKQL